MPVTKTAKRALRGSKKKAGFNKILNQKLEIAVRIAKKSKNIEDVRKATSLADQSAKRKIIHKNKAARIKSQLSKVLTKTSSKKTTQKVVTKAKKSK